MHRQFVPTESTDHQTWDASPTVRPLQFSSTGHLLNLALMKISLLYLPQQRYITADAKGVFSLRTVLDWPTFRAVVDLEIAPLFDLFLGLSAWIPVYSLHVEKRYDNQGLVIALQDTSATDVIWDLTHVIANIPCMLYPNIFSINEKNVEASQGWTWNWRLTLHVVQLLIPRHLITCHTGEQAAHNMSSHVVTIVWPQR